jgi:Transcriptional activator of glycolytic enzymes
MRDNVSSMISPIDTAIDRALPGVLHAIKANGLKTDLVLQAQKESIKAIEGGLDRVVQELQGSTFGLRNQMGKALRAAGDVFTVSNDTNGSNINGNSSTLPQVPTITTPTAMANIRILTPSEPPFIGYGYEPDWQDVKNIQSVYNQWYGKGFYNCKPVPSGIEKMELNHKTKWRVWQKNQAASKSFSRMKRVIEEL